MSQILGYIISILGLAVVALSKKIASLPFLAGIAKINTYTLLAGIILIVVGVALLMSKSGFSSSGKIKQAQDEVPIYEGEGKKRKIVGYKRAK